MQTRLADFIRDTPEGQEAERILRKCVHCGFCNATCPTYQLLGDELDGPRGRIYQIKQVLEGEPATVRTQQHLDRCLTCRSCETTCPSGVEYHRLADIGRAVIDRQVPRPAAQRALRLGLRQVLPRQGLFTAMVRSGQSVRGLLPGPLKRTLPPRRPAGAWPQPRHERRMVVLDGCVQPGLAPSINAALARLLDRLGISLIRARRDGCCGALSYHLNAQSEGLDYVRQRVDAWSALLEQGAEAILVSASGCGAFVKDYEHLLAEDPAYRDRAGRVVAAMRDPVEVLATEDIAGLRGRPAGRLAFHCPCTLQHALRLGGRVERILTDLGFELTTVADSHLCCGSAGTYSILQKELSHKLRQRRIDALTRGEPDGIATANIGCLLHLQEATGLPVRHWLEWVDAALES